jgi:hypothetical protein
MIKKTLQGFIDEAASKFYLNEHTSPYAYVKLGDRERQEVLASVTLHEYALFSESGESTSIAMNEAISHAKDSSQFKAANSFNSVYFDKVRASGGDITKTPNFANCQVLAKYSRAESKDKVFIDKMDTLADALTNMVKYKSQFVEAVKREKEEISDESKRVVTQYYINLVMMIDIGVDVLYSSSAQAEIDYSSTPAIVKRMYFVAQPETLADTIGMIHYFNSLAVSGKLSKVLTKNGAAELAVASGRILKENFLDLAFALATGNDWTELLLFPLYMIRSAIYFVKYITALYGKMTFGLQRSIDMQRATKVTESEFQSYSSEASKKALMFDQAVRQASSDTEHEFADNRAQIKGMAAAGDGGMLM